MTIIKSLMGKWTNRSAVKWVKPTISPEQQEAANNATLLTTTVPIMDDEFAPVMSQDVFWKLLRYCHGSPDNEIAGYGEYNIRTNTIVTVHHDAATGTGKHVDVRSDMTAVLLEAIQAGQPLPKINVQWHTHPHFGTFFSDQDRSSQWLALQRAIAAQPDGGELLFLVMDSAAVAVSLCMWGDGVPIGRFEGSPVVSLGDGSYVSLKYIKEPVAGPLAWPLVDTVPPYLQETDRYDAYDARSWYDEI